MRTTRLTPARALALGSALIATVLAAGPASLAAAADATPFVVVVNAANPVAELPAKQVSRYFLKSVSTWDDGRPVQPVDLPPNSGVRDDFSLVVHGKPAAPIVSFWQQQIFSGRGVPPPQKRSDAEVVEFVRQNPGGIGYVAAGIALGDGVKILRLGG